MKQLLVLVFAFVTALSAHAQDVGFIAGISNTSATKGDAALPGTSLDSEIGWRLGVNIRLDLADKFDFRTGATYTMRPVTATNSVAGDMKIKMSYVDIPALFQYHFNDMIAGYVGPVVGLKVGEKVSGAANGDLSDAVPGTDVKSIYLLGQIGANFNFDGVGFDVYYERGFGDVATHVLKDYSIFGANFVYWF